MVKRTGQHVVRLYGTRVNLLCHAEPEADRQHYAEVPIIRLCPGIIGHLGRAKVDGSVEGNRDEHSLSIIMWHGQLFQVHGVAWRTRWRCLEIAHDAVLCKFIKRFDVTDDQAGLLSGPGVSDMRGTYPTVPPQLQV